MPPGSFADPLEFTIEIRLIQQGKITQVKMRTQPALSNEATVYFETSEDSAPFDRLQLYAQQARIQEMAPNRFIATPYAYFAKHKRQKSQKLERIILEVSGYTFAIRLAGEAENGIYKLVYVSSVDEDDDGAFAQAQTLKNSRLLQFCPDYDSNAIAHPLQSEFFFTHRGDASFDWNCNGKVNLSKVKMGKPGKYELRDGVCVEVVSLEPGWADVVPTQVGAIAHCFIVLGGSGVAASAPDDPPVCISPHTRCIQGGN